MKYASLILSLTALLVVTSCAKPEIIPAPDNKIEYRAHFKALVNGAEVEFTEHVEDYFCETEKLVDTIPGIPNSDSSFCVYYSQIKSEDQSIKQSVGIGLGWLEFNPTITSTPALNQFNEFFEESPTYDFVTLAQEGVQVVYIDETGKVWTSEDGGAGETFEIVEMEQVSDETGDYLIFTANFSCQLYFYDANGNQTSITIQDAVYDGVFKR
ncbi:hypothetical protein [Lishizhenia sp.]|uniref:hypothetical protein n=1 Tax=Lishizhenia sp. TaxID=2497594 RepID=UPI00299EB9B5|nr:hypothetical protein [Lishizhenia sp.]MDX1444629.1 hypothetical protein [Lishizhenia sp.]